MPSPWTALRAAVDPLARRLGYYTAYAIGHDEYVGALDQGYTVRDARTYLEQNAYQPQYLSAAKRLPGTGELHALSYRRVPAKHPAEAINTTLAEQFRPEACQLHVHVWPSDDSGPLFFSHYEARPDFLEPDVSPRRMRTHYRPTYGETYLMGVTDLDL
jgi:hypothetical protein